MKPKAYFLIHYPEMIRRFGPLVKTLRFETKHQYFKSLIYGKTGKKISNNDEKTPIYDVLPLFQGVFSRT